MHRFPLTPSLQQQVASMSYIRVSQPCLEPYKFLEARDPLLIYDTILY